MSVVETVRDKLLGGIAVDWDRVQPIPLTQREIHDLLSSDRRRILVSVLVDDRDGTATLAELTQDIARIENGIPQNEEVTTRQRKRTYVSLYQTHLPKLEMHGVVEWDDDDNTIHATTAAVGLAKVVRGVNRVTAGVPA